MLNNPTLKQWLMPSMLAIIALVLFVFDKQLAPLWQFDRFMIEQGQWWRLFSGNLFHTNDWHLVFNLAGLLMLTQLFGRDISPSHFAIFTVLNATLVGVLLHLYSPDIEIYVGLSGYLHGLFVLGCLIEIAAGRRSSVLLLLGISAKISWENTAGASQKMTDLIDANIATDAHLFGALAAIPLFIGYYLLIKVPSKNAANAIK